MTATALLAEVSVFTMALRLVVSLAIVLGMIAALTWVARRPKGLGFGTQSRDAIAVRGRQQLGRASTIALLQVGDRTILVGANEHSIQVLAEGDDMLPPEPEPDPAQSPLTTGDRTSPYAGSDGPASPWTNIMEMLREWSVRRT